MSLLYITDHFSWLEAACHDGTEVPDELKPNARRQAAMMEKIRRRWGAPLHILSWYRTPTHNSGVGGKEHSRHLTADGTDIHPTALSDIPQLIVCVEKMIAAGELEDLGGFGQYPAWIHVDSRPRAPVGHIARWFGKGFGAEVA